MSGMTPSRRDALKSIAALALAPALVGLTRKGQTVAGQFVDDGSERGHAVRDGKWEARRNREELVVDVAIIGGGIGGLSAGWQLESRGLHDWVLLEMQTVTGGNAKSVRPGQFQLREAPEARAPWGAHYVPVPAADAHFVRKLLSELGVLDADGRWDERTLCHSPQERLWQHGRWHEGLEPHDALNAAERRQFERFDERMAEWRSSRMFSVPSATGHQVRTNGRRGGGHRAQLALAVEQLDSLTADQWLRNEGFNSPALRWLVEYGLRDDYGSSLSQASAWAAVHYFAGRDSEEHGPLTWPEGNDFIAQALTERLNSHARTPAGRRIRTGETVGRVERSQNHWIVESDGLRVKADVIIWAAPIFMLPKIMRGVTLPVAVEYAPWVVANLVLDRWPVERGFPLAWDNVIYGSKSLGYVNAAHQSLARPSLPQVWTWYHAITDQPSAVARNWLLNRSWYEWRDEIINDLSVPHPDIEQCIARIDIMRWGHAMIRPTPGVLKRVDLLGAWQPKPSLFFAHGDLSGISLFEEAQWHGVHAANSAVSLLGRSGSGRSQRDASSSGETNTGSEEEAPTQ